MNGTKWYKLNKSNEPLEIAIEEQVSRLEEYIDKRSSSTITEVGGTIFSSILAVLVEKAMISYDFSSGVFSFLGTVNPVAKTIIIYIVVFITASCICRVLSILARKITKAQDNKKHPEQIENLKKYFYKKVLNDIVTGISLEKKASELQEANASGVIQDQDKALISIYLTEAVYYFNQASRGITDFQLVEYPNEKRKNYALYLEDIGADTLERIFKLCTESLGRIANVQMDFLGASVIDSAMSAKMMFISYVAQISKSKEMSDAKGSDKER